MFEKHISLFDLAENCIFSNAGFETFMPSQQEGGGKRNSSNFARWKFIKQRGASVIYRLDLICRHGTASFSRRRDVSLIKNTYNCTSREDGRQVVPLSLASNILLILLGESCEQCRVLQ